MGGEDPLEEGMETHSSILIWRIPWTEEFGRLQCTGSQSQTWLKQLSTRSVFLLILDVFAFAFSMGDSRSVMPDSLQPHGL